MKLVHCTANVALNPFPARTYLTYSLRDEKLVISAAYLAGATLIERSASAERSSFLNNEQIRV